jgi:ATP-binding cassette subfamily B multidrug efflux pump
MTFRPYRRSLTMVILLQLTQTYAALLLPGLNADIIDHGVVPSDTGYILQVGGPMLAITVGQICCAAGTVYFSVKVASAVGRDLRAAIFAKVQEFSAREVGRFGTPSLITRTTNDVQQVQMLVLMTFTLVVVAPIMCVGGVVMAVQQDVPLSGLLTVSVPVLAVSITFIVRRMRPQYRLMQGRIDRMSRILREQISGIRVIRAFVREDHEQERFGAANRDLTDVALRVNRLMALMFPVVLLVLNLTSVAVLWFGGIRVDTGSVQIGALTAFLSYLTQILLSVMMATFMFIMWPRAEVCAERIHELLDTDSSVVLRVKPVSVLARPGELRLSSVEFRYPGAEHATLRSVDLSAGPGQTVAVIGSTGSGKTTLLNLVPRLFDATGGSVTVGGIDVRDIDPVVLANTVGMVPQKAYLFSGTVASNLRYGKPDATDDELWHALDIAQARVFVQEMPGRLDSPISQGGTNVSGGQRQRLAIARTVLLRPTIYLFDDSFSALDYATDAALRTALVTVTSEATVVMVAQRITTIRQVDRIVVLDQGSVVGVGTHDELLAGNETYQEIVFSQLSDQEAQ